MGKAFASPRAARAARPAGAGAAQRRGARAGERAVDGEHLAAPAGAARRRAWSPARARARACATRSPATRRCGSGSRCATPRRRAWPRSSAPPATTSARTSRRSAARSCSTRLARGDVVLVDVRPERGVRGRAHRGRALDPARRARAPARRAAGRHRGRGLLPRPVLRLRARGGPAPARRGPHRAPARGRLARMATRPNETPTHHGGDRRMSTGSDASSTPPSSSSACKRMYEEVALEPEREFHFETGRPLAERLGYPPADLDRHPGAGDRLVRRRRLLPRPRRDRARRERCSTSAAARAWTASWPRLPPGATAG